MRSLYILNSIGNNQYDVWDKGAYFQLQKRDPKFVNTNQKFVILRSVADLK